ncbi:MAG: hypothetical protein ACK5NA_08120 [Enterococcus sp.]
MEEKPTSAMKKFTKLVSHTSYQFFDSFLNDTEIDIENARIQREFVRRLHTAALEKSLVVLQVKLNKLSLKNEVVSGWIVEKSIESGRVLVRLKDAEEQLRLIPIEQIQRITTFSPNGEREKLSR